MLTRYRQTYNILTHSKAFSETGKVDNTKVNKQDFTPNNLKAVLFGSTKIWAWYYTTNDTDRYLQTVYEYQFNIKTDEDLKQIQKEEKGMVDALFAIGGLKFSNIEEVYIVKDDFMEDDFRKELSRLEKFISNRLLTQQSFKRLHCRGVIEQGTIAEIQQRMYQIQNSQHKDVFNDLYTIKEKMEYVGVKVTAKENPDREVDKEFGICTDVELNSGEYLLDTPYNPDVEYKTEKERKSVKLSRYFYNQRLKAGSKLKEDRKQAEQEKKVQIDEVAVNLYIDKIMKVYRDLYESCFNLKKPVGVLTPEGILRIYKGETKLERSKEYVNLYELAIKSSKCDVQVDTNILEGVKIEDLYKTQLKGTYYPIFHLAVMTGRTPNWKFKSWNIKEKRIVNGKEITTSLEEEIKGLIRNKLIKGYEDGKNLAELADSFCTSFVVTELANTGEGSILMFKVKFSAGNGKFNIEAFKRGFIEGGDTYFAGGAQITARGPKTSGVCQVNLCLNEDLYQMMPLFAYEAVEHQKARGKRISIKNCVIGQTVDDEILTLNLTKNDAKVINILAGPRAGKGVLTLNILGTILSDGCPLIYMDAKPDMATVLNEVANKNGVRVAAWDLNTPPLEYLKSNPVMERLSEAKVQALRDMGSNIPKELEESTSDSTMGLLAYLKVLQLTMVSAKLQKDRKIKTPGAGQAFFILDELLRVYSELEVFYNILNTIEKDKKADEELRVWCSKMTSWVRKLGQDFTGSMVAEMPNSHTSVFCLYQKASTWKNSSGKPTPTQAVFTPLITAGNATKLVGGANATTEGYESLYALQQQDRDLATKVTQYRHFGMYNGKQLNDASQCTVFKSYLVLNNAEMDSQYVQDMRNNIGERAFEDLLAKGGGVVPDGVGFEGYMNTIGSEGIQSLSKGYEYLTDILNVTGLSEKYGSIEEYLYDSDINSFYSKNILVEGRANEVSREVKKDKEVLKDNGSWNLSEEDYVVEDYKDELSGVNEQDFSNNERPEVKSNNQNFNSQDRPKRPTRPQRHKKQSSNYELKGNVYSEELKIEKNPFRDYKGEGMVSTINALRDITDIIINDIKKIIGDYSLITKFGVIGDGVLVFNDTVYTPKFEQSFIESLPIVLQDKIEQGFLVEFFNLRTIYKFKNLQEIVVENQNLAQGRARKELGIGYRKRFSVLFKNFRDLNYINVGGIEYTRENPDSRGEEGFLLPNSGFLSNLFKPKTPQQQINKGSGWMDKVWDSKPVKVLTNAFGWTVGTQAVIAVATLMGPWGLLFGGLAFAGAYKELKGNSPGGNNNSSKSSSSFWGGKKVELKKTVYFTVGKKGIMFYTDKNLLKSFNVKQDIQQELYKIAGQGGSGEIKVYEDGTQEVKQLGQAYPLPGNKGSKPKDKGNTHHNGE